MKCKLGGKSTILRVCEGSEVGYSFLMTRVHGLWMLKKNPIHQGQPEGQNSSTTDMTKKQHKQGQHKTTLKATQTGFFHHYGIRKKVKSIQSSS